MNEKNSPEDQRPIVHCHAECGQVDPLDSRDVSDKIFWAYRKIIALAELMQGFNTDNGSQDSFGIAGRYAHLEYPILMGIGSELAWLHDKMERPSVDS